MECTCPVHPHDLEPLIPIQEAAMLIPMSPRALYMRLRRLGRQAIYRRVGGHGPIRRVRVIPASDIRLIRSQVLYGPGAAPYIYGGEG